MNTEEKKKILEENHLIIPYKKSNGKWGVKGSSLMDKKTEDESVNDFYEYCLIRGLLK